MTDPVSPMAKAVAAKGGFRRKRKVYVLDFEGTDLDGLTAKVRSAPIGEFMRLGELADELETTETVAEMKAVMDVMLGLFDDVLVEWDLVDDDGVPIPATAAGMAQLEMDEVMLFITAWQNAVAAVPAPLSPASNAGSPSLVGSMPMEPKSPSLAS